MEKRKHIFWETLLIIGSIFTFRGAWHLMDKISLLDTPSFLWISVFFGILLMAISYFRIVHADKPHLDKKKK